MVVQISHDRKGDVSIFPAHDGGLSEATDGGQKDDSVKGEPGDREARNVFCAALQRV